MAYALSVVGARYRWLIEQRYTLANPFSGLKVRGADRTQGQAVMRVFSEREWATIQLVAQARARQEFTTSAPRVAQAWPNQTGRRSPAPPARPRGGP